MSECNFYNELIFSDCHKPYNHPDAFSFLFAVADFYDVKNIYDLGDDEDQHALSYHEHDPNLLSDDAELKAVIRENQKWYKAFPEIKILESNHGSLLIRKAKTHGLSDKRIKSMQEVIEAPNGWQWHERIIIERKNFKILLKHQIKKNTLLAAQKIGCSIIQGHFHSQCNIQYFMNELGQLSFGASCPCLIDSESRAFAYNKNDIDRPVLGCIVLQNGVPKIIPMILDKKGRWIKHLV